MTDSEALRIMETWVDDQAEQAREAGFGAGLLTPVEATQGLEVAQSLAGLVEVMQDDDEVMRRRAAMAFRTTLLPVVRDMLLAELVERGKSRNNTIRMKAILALQGLGVTALSQVSFALMRCPSPRGRCRLVALLAAIGPPNDAYVEAQLQRVAGNDDEDHAVRSTARLALQRLYPDAPSPQDLSPRGQRTPAAGALEGC